MVLCHTVDGGMMFITTVRNPFSCLPKLTPRTCIGVPRPTLITLCFLSVIVIWSVQFNTTPMCTKFLLIFKLLPMFKCQMQKGNKHVHKIHFTLNVPKCLFLESKSCLVLFHPSEQPRAVCHTIMCTCTFILRSSNKVVSR